MIDTKTLEQRETELIALVNSDLKLPEEEHKATLREIAGIQSELLNRWKPANPHEDLEYCDECGGEIETLELSGGLCQACQCS